MQSCAHLAVPHPACGPNKAALLPLGLPPAMQGRYVSISAATRVSLCVVEVYPLVSNAALGKRTTASGPSTDAAQGQVVNGRIDNQQCAQVMSGANLAAWITIDLGYEAAVETVVVVNGLSKFTNDLYIRCGGPRAADRHMAGHSRSGWVGAVQLKPTFCRSSPTPFPPTSAAGWAIMLSSMEMRTRCARSRKRCLNAARCPSSARAATQPPPAASSRCTASPTSPPACTFAKCSCTWQVCGGLVAM